jgi:hypothetical protein
MPRILVNASNPEIISNGRAAGIPYIEIRESGTKNDTKDDTKDDATETTRSSG